MVRNANEMRTGPEGDLFSFGLFVNLIFLALMGNDYSKDHVGKFSKFTEFLS